MVCLCMVFIVKRGNEDIPSITSEELNTPQLNSQASC